MQTQKAINHFEKANPNIKVTIRQLSPNSTTYLSQLEHDLIAGSSTPDMFESDVTYPAKFAKAGWVLPLTQFNPDTSQFFASQVAAGQFQGKTYAIPFFDNPEGPVLPHRLGADAPEDPGRGGRRRPGRDEKGPQAQRGPRVPGR
jgi:multiple sugar transport system substrate-binding protein